MIFSEHVQRARQTDLVEWLSHNNVHLIRTGKWWSIKGNDSLRIQGNKWYRNSKGNGGNSIDFLVDYYGLSPIEAIMRLTQGRVCSLNKKSGVKEKNKYPQMLNRFRFDSITPAPDQRRILAYLSKTRGIPSDIVRDEIQAGQLFQESRSGNAIFVMSNEVGITVGAEVVGTHENIRFKGIKAGSNGGYGYSVGQKQSPRYILFFESAVDLLSFTAIMRSRAKTLTSCLLVSMAGLKIRTVQNSLHVFGDNMAIPVLCADNDKAGKNFIARCLTFYPSAIINQPDKSFKDWNDQLRGKCSANILC